MPISQQEVRGVGVCLDTAGARLRHVPYRTIDRVRRYRLCEAVTTLRPREVAAARTGAPRGRCHTA